MRRCEAMRIKILKLLCMFCMLCVTALFSGCGGNDAEQDATPESATAVPEATAETPLDSIVFNDEEISLNDYVSLMSLYEQISFDNVIIEDNYDFMETAEQYGREDLYELHEFIDALSASEAGQLHRIALGILNNL